MEKPFLTLRGSWDVGQPRGKEKDPGRRRGLVSSRKAVPGNALLLISPRGPAARRRGPPPASPGSACVGWSPPLPAPAPQRCVVRFPLPGDAVLSLSAKCFLIGTSYISLWLMANCLDYFYCCTHYVN